MNESTIYDFMLLRWRRWLHLMLSHTPQARPDVCSRAGVIASLKHASRCSNVHSCSLYTVRSQLYCVSPFQTRQHNLARPQSFREGASDLWTQCHCCVLPFSVALRQYPCDVDGAH